MALYQLIYFMECKLVKSSDPSISTSFWVAAASEFMEHPCKVWFGNPVEVWCMAPNSIDIKFIPVSFIKKQVVYTKTKFSFGQIIGEDHVFQLNIISRYIFFIKSYQCLAFFKKQFKFLWCFFWTWSISRKSRTALLRNSPKFRKAKEVIISSYNLL